MNSYNRWPGWKSYSCHFLSQADGIARNYLEIKED